MEENKKLIGKLILKGEIEVLTGLAIGGSKSGIDIGALDNPVIKYHKGKESYPYIPGSSLKGKVRALLAKVAGLKSEAKDKEEMRNEKSDFKHLATIFGYGADRTDATSAEALLKFSDCFMIEEKGCTTEEKMENTIDRISGRANPRPIERVLPETVFNVELILDVYDEDKVEEQLKLLDLGIELLNKDYLGGGGTRGNGRIIMKLKVDKYYKINSSSKALEDKLSDTDTLKDFKFTSNNEN